MPRRSAIVAFSTDSVYAIAELIRRQRGGAAVVKVLLSPRTRNAQVNLFQSGEVDFLVATDAIGMGLNMDVDHVAFAGLRKFDGRRLRGLYSQEIAQIAGSCWAVSQGWRLRGHRRRARSRCRRRRGGRRPCLSHPPWPPNGAIIGLSNTLNQYITIAVEATPALAAPASAELTPAEKALIASVHSDALTAGSADAPRIS